MTKLTVFCMTNKGMAVVSAIHAKYPGMIEAVICSRDKAMAEDFYDETHEVCRRNSINFFDRKDSFRITTEFLLAISWRWLINHDSRRLVVFHDSLLPRYRGFNPLVTALVNGDKRIGVTALLGTEEYDKGDIIAQSQTEIEYPITIAEAIKKIQFNYVSLGLFIADVLHREEDFPSTQQSEIAASYSLWRDEEDYFIDWTESAAKIRRFIDAVGFPYKSAASFLNGKIVRILKAQPVDDVAIENRTPGKVIFVRDSKPVVVCGSGLLRIDELRDELGENILPLSQFRTRFRGKG